MRLVSLLPSATEVVCELGLKSYLVGISHECDYPATVAHLPRVTASKVNASDTSRGIHDSVEALIRQALSVYDLDLDLLDTLNPDFVITQDLCDVCAVPLGQVETACREVLGEQTRLITLRPQRLKDIWDDIRRVAEVLGRQEDCERFLESVDGRIAAIEDTLNADGVKEKKRILTLEWMDPVMVGGLWVPEMIGIAGGEALFAAAGEKARTVNRGELDTINPDVVIVKPCGFKLGQTIRELDRLKACAPWDNWKATQNGNVFLVDGNAYFNRPGPRILDSIEILAYCAHPEVFPELGDIYASSIIRLGPALSIPE